MSEPEDTTPKEDRTGLNRRRLLQTVGVAAAGFVGVTGTASAHKSKFFGCQRVCTGTQGSYAVVAVDDTYRCREMQQASGTTDVPWDWTTYCYEATDGEVVVGLLEENVIQGGTKNENGTCALCLNGNDCATAAYDSASTIVTALNESDTCDVCAGNVEVGSSCTTYTAPGDGDTDTGGGSDGSTDSEDGTSGDDTGGGSDDGSGGTDDSGDTDGSDESSGDDSSSDGDDGSSGDESSGDSGSDGTGGEDSNGDEDGSSDAGSGDDSTDGGNEDDSPSSDESSGDGGNGSGGENSDSDDSSDSGGDGNQSETNPSDEQGSDDGSPNDETNTGSRNNRSDNGFDINDDYRDSRDPTREYPDVDLEELAERRAEQEYDDGPAWECEGHSGNRTAMERWYDRDDTPADPQDRNGCDSDDDDGTMTAMERWFARLDTPDIPTLFDSKR